MKFWTSDNHFEHANIIHLCNRPYRHVDEMNEDMVRRWNEVVKPDDEVFILGDFSLSFTAVERFPHRLNGLKKLVPGNHDRCHTYHKDSRNDSKHKEMVKKYTDLGFEVLPQQVTMFFEGLGEVNMCHHPYSGKWEAENGDKYANWRPVDNGKILLCGHVHEKWITQRSPAGTFMLNVGTDAHNFTPISLEQVIKLCTETKST